MDSAQEFSGLEEMELKERIKRLKDQEKALRDELHLLESRLRNLILARYAGTETISERKQVKRLARGAQP